MQAHVHGLGLLPKISNVPEQALGGCPLGLGLVLLNFHVSHSSFQLVRDHHSPDGVIKVVKMFQSAPTDWPSCVRLARVKFEKYFNHKVKLTVEFLVCVHVAAVPD